MGFLGPDRDGNARSWTVDGDRDKLARTLRVLADRDKILVMYNGDHFDIPVIRAILKGLDPYAIATGLIRDGKLPVALTKMPALPGNHIAVSARLRRGGRIPSLKRVAAYLGRPRLQELPYPPGAILDDAQWAEVLEYNAIDLQHTRALLERYGPELQALGALSEEQGQDLRSVPTPQVVERVFRAALGHEPVVPEPLREVIYRGVTGVRKPRTPEAAAWYDQVVNQPLAIVGEGDHKRLEVPKARFLIGPLDVAVGSGGLHSDDRVGVHYATKRVQLLSVDVVSYYPSLIAAKGISPAAYGACGTATYRGILELRLEVKARARDTRNPAERDRLDVQATALKLVLNSTFGKLGDPYSSLYDPGAMLAVTLSGQIMLIDLIERVAGVGARVLSANTDGLFLTVRRDDRRWRKVLREWQVDTGMTLEVDRLQRLAILATNRVATLDDQGKIKRRGAGVKGDLSPVAAPNALVVADAVVDALLRDIPPERTIRACRDPVRFCSVSARTATVASAVLRDATDGSETELPKVVRWYRAKDSTLRIEHRLGSGHTTTPANAVQVGLALDLEDGRLPEDLDCAWYAAQARKVVQAIPGYRHRSRARLLSHPAATEVFARGLVPIPERGKAQPAGSDPKAPTLLWDWAIYPTVGTYTGPGVALLVIDVDDCARFKTWVDRNNSPLLADRWRDLDDCLVSYHGDTTADQVRGGHGRGKLIFRLVGDPSHPLAKIPVGRWKDSRGVEIFYGKGLPSILGAHPDGTEYRLDGTLGDPPAWLVQWLTPKTRLTRDGVGSPRKVARAIGKVETPEAAEAARELLEGLPGVLAALAPELSLLSVGWHCKGLDEGRVIWFGRCPYEHDSGTSSDGDLAAGHNQDGVPYVRCRHLSCTEIPALNARIREGHQPSRGPATEPPPMDATEIARTFERDLDDHLVSYHQAPTGSGKSHSAAQAAVLRYRAGSATLIAVPTIRLAEETMGRLREFAPDAIEVDAIAGIFGNHRQALDAHAEVDPDTGSAADESGRYPIREWSHIVICTHAQIGRRGFSKFIRAIWAKLVARDDAHGHRPAFALIVDEASELIRACRQEIPLGHRVMSRRNPDRSGGRLVPLQECPKWNWSGNCNNCELRKFGGEVRFNTFSIRDLGLPWPIEFDADAGELRKPHRPLVVTPGDLEIEPLKTKVGDTTFAARVLSWQGEPIEQNTRRAAPVYLFQKSEDGSQAPETPTEILGHMLRFAFRPVVTWEHPIDPEGKPIDPATLKFRIDAGEKSWDADIVFPHDTCGVPRLRFTDMAPLDQMRRFAQQNEVGIVFAGATLSSDDAEVVREIWPKLVVRSHPYPARKIRQAAVVFVEDHRGIGSLVDDDRRLVTRPLETIGLGVVFCATRRAATTLYEYVKLDHPSVHMADGNDEKISVDACKTLHLASDLGCYVTYSRGVLGLGANVKDVRFLVVDALAFRSIASFTPGEVTPEAFERARAEERLALLMQNLGRALRGEAGKTVVLIILNADPKLIEAI